MILGFVGCVRSFWVMGYERWRAQQDSVKGGALYQAVEKATKDLRRVLAFESHYDKLPQAQDSPIFPLISMINQSLSQKNEVSTLIDEQSHALQKGIFDMDTSVHLLVNKASSQKKITEDVTNAYVEHTKIAEAVHQNVQDVYQ